jgi:hypothetical protein
VTPNPLSIALIIGLGSNREEKMEVCRTSRTDHPTPFILESCVNIKNLRIIPWWGETYLSYQGHHLAWATRNLKLESLDIAPSHIRVIHLLKSQPTLRSLRLPNKYKWPFEDLLPTDIPCLRSVAGSVRWVEKLVPNRPVEDVEVKMSPYYFMATCPGFFEQLGRSTEPIKGLVLQLKFADGRKVVDVSDAFHKLIDLEDSILRGLEEFEIRTASLQMPLVGSSFALSIYV